MYVIRREDQVNPFAVIAHVVSEDLMTQAITEELGADELTYKDFDKLKTLDWGETLTLECEIIEEDGEVVDWEIEVTKLVSYI